MLYPELFGAYRFTSSTMSLNGTEKYLRHIRLGALSKKCLELRVSRLAFKGHFPASSKVFLRILFWKIWTQWLGCLYRFNGSTKICLGSSRHCQYWEMLINWLPLLHLKSTITIPPNASFFVIILSLIIMKHWNVNRKHQNSVVLSLNL